MSTYRLKNLTLSPEAAANADNRPQWRRWWNSMFSWRRDACVVPLLFDYPYHKVRNKGVSL